MAFSRKSGNHGYSESIDIGFVVAYVPKILLGKKFSCTCRWTQGRLDKGMFQKR